MELTAVICDNVEGEEMMTPEEESLSFPFRVREVFLP